MIDILREDVISLPVAASLLPARRGGKRPHISCLYRWTLHGCRGVVLDSVQIGGTRCTSREALHRFVAELSAQRSDAAGRVGQQPSRERQILAAERELDQICPQPDPRR